MTDYTPSESNFAAKDDLPPGDANKVISGELFDTEFSAISTAINSKANLVSPEFTGTPSAPTAATDTNTTQLATTAFVQQEINATLTAGTEGLDGNSFLVVYVYQRASSAPSTPSGGSFNFDTLILTAPSGWSRNIPSGTDPVYVSTATATTVGSSGVDDTLTWSTPVVAFQNGDDGTTADTKFASGYLYYETSSSSAPTAPVEDVDTTDFNFASGTFNTLKAGWTHVFEIPDLSEGQKFWAVYYTVEEDVDGNQTITITNTAFNWINFDGLVTFTNIQTGIANNVTTIDGGKIGTNTLNANAIETGTLTADKISSGNVDSGVEFQLGSDVDDIGGVDAGASFKSTSSSKAGVIAANTTNFPAIVAAKVNGTNFAGGFYNTTSSSFGTPTNYAELANSNVAGNFNGDVTISGTVNPFTGSHICLTSSQPAQGDIVVDTGAVQTVDFSTTVTTVMTTTSANNKAVVGVFVKDTAKEHFGGTINPQGLFENIDLNGNTLCQINAVGEGKINVCGENGDIEVGDLIVTSTIAGKGMKQSDDVVRNYTVAKAREAVTFSSPTEVRQIACIYMCG